ncbi:Protein NATD1 [Lemmus lemmus]
MPPLNSTHSPLRNAIMPLFWRYGNQGCHDRAVLLYEYVGKRIVDLQHTEVPDAYRGRGIAKHLAKAALDFVVEEDLKAHLTCWYIQKYVKENPLPQYLERLQP